MKRRHNAVRVRGMIPENIVIYIINFFWKRATQKLSVSEIKI